MIIESFVTESNAKRLEREHVATHVRFIGVATLAVVDAAVVAGELEFAGQGVGADQRDAAALTADRRTAVGGVADECDATRGPGLQADLGGFVEVEVAAPSTAPRT